MKRPKYIKSKNVGTLLLPEDAFYVVERDDGIGFDVVRKADGKTVAEQVMSFSWYYGTGHLKTNYEKKWKINKQAEKVILLGKK